MSQTYLFFRFGLLTFFLLLATFSIVTFHWQIFFTSPPAELEYNHHSIKNFPSISPITFDSTEFSGDEIFRGEKSFTSTGQLDSIIISLTNIY